MTGLAFFVGGCDRSEQFFNPTVAQTISMFLLLAVLSLMVPTISRLVVADIEPSGILAQSRGTAIVIMISYALWLIFQLKTNRALFDEVGQKAPKIIDQKVIQPGTSYRGLAVVGAGVGAAIGGAVNKSNIVGDPIEFEDPDEEEIPQLTPECATVASVIFTTLLAFNIQFATDSIQGLMSQHNLTDSFMGITILPILSNDITVLVVARMDKMDMALSLTLERAIQTSLMIVPIVILVAWGIGIDGMSLDFDGFSVSTRTLSGRSMSAYIFALQGSIAVCLGRDCDLCRSGRQI
jgi:Ca2+:H+ antiporter